MSPSVRPQSWAPPQWDEPQPAPSGLVLIVCALMACLALALLVMHEQTSRDACRQHGGSNVQCAVVQ